MARRATEAFSRVKIDALLRDVGWRIDDGVSVVFEMTLTDGTAADYVLCDRRGRPLAVLEAKRARINAETAERQGRHYAGLLGVPFIFLSNGEEVWFLDVESDAHPRRIGTVYAQEDLERRSAARAIRRDLHEVAIDRTIVNRDYQMACVDALCAEIGHGRRKFLVEMATGTGKTRTAAALIKRLLEAGAITRVLFLVDRIALASQAEDAFSEHLRDYPSYVLRSRRGLDTAKSVTIATLQTMINEYANFSSGYFDLIITDECHRSIYGEWSGVLKHFDGMQLGLTATPCTVDAEAMPDPEDGAFVRDTLRFFEVTAPTFRYTLSQAIAEGHLVPYWIYKARTVKTAAEGGFAVRRDELDWSAMDAATQAEFAALFGESETITVDPRALERRFTIPERNRAMVREFREVLEKGYTGTDGVHRWPLLGKTIVFAVTKRHASTLAAMFDDHFADLKPQPTVKYADYVVSDVGDGPGIDASTIIRRFKAEQFPKILVSVNMLDTGFDCPEVVNLVMARFTQSVILYRQMRGRGTRRAPHIRKSHFTMFDFVGLADFHGDDEDAIDGGMIVARAARPGPSEPRNLLTLDVHDHIDPASRDWATLDENGRIVRTPEHEARASAFGLRFETWLANQPLTAEQERWARMMESYVKANARHIDGLHDYDLDESPFRERGGCDAAVRVFGGAAALAALLASLNRSLFGAGPAGTAADDARPAAH